MPDTLRLRPHCPRTDPGGATGTLPAEALPRGERGRAQPTTVVRSPASTRTGRRLFAGGSGHT